MASPEIDKIDDVIHGRLRLGMMAHLANAETASFTELKTLLGATQGNLSIQMRKLEDAGYIKVEKRFEGRKPLTTLRITSQGRAAMERYLEALSSVLGIAPKR